VQSLPRVDPQRPIIYEKLQVSTWIHRYISGTKGGTLAGAYLLNGERVTPQHQHNQLH